MRNYIYLCGMSKYLRGVLVSGIGRGSSTSIGIDVDIRYNTEAHYNQIGQIAEIGNVSGKRFIHSDEDYELESYLRVGDDVMVSWVALSKGFEVRDGVWWCSYEDIIGVFRDDGLVPVNGNIFYEGERKNGVVVAVSSDMAHNISVGDSIGCRGGFAVESDYNQVLERKIYYVHNGNIIWAI